jgi:GNAT superfamily N-acetyltransferase
MHDILDYYSRSPSSGFWILDYDDHFVGLIALDASAQVAETAVVRHFYVDEVYRSSGVQVDLVRHAVQVAFDSDDKILRINASDSPLTPYIGTCLQEAGFAVEYPIEEVGLFKWKIYMRTLEREVWKQLKITKSS